MSSGFNSMPQDRLKRALAAFVRELFPSLDYMGFYEYTVVAFSVALQTAVLRAVRTNGLPQTLINIPARLPGVTVDLDVGTSVLVGFDDQLQPYIAFLDKFSGTGPSFTGLAGAMPTDVPPVGGGIARVGDSAGPFLITTGSVKVKSR